MMILFKSRYAVLFNFIIIFLAFSFITRTALLIESFTRADISVEALFVIYVKGFLFDTSVALFFTTIYAIYLLLLPQKWNNSAVNKMITITSLFLILSFIIFSFCSEIGFWNEFESRFNFIAVDYLVYANELINDARQTYPLNYILGGIALISILIIFLLYKRNVFYASFHSVTQFNKRLLISGGIIATACLAAGTLSNSWAETNTNRYLNELSKAGLFSFVAAFRDNELNYADFYKKEDAARVFKHIRTALQESNSIYSACNNTIKRSVDNAGIPAKPNVILITVESLSADFLGCFGNPGNLTPNLDMLASQGIVFTDMYATGSRTVRGMEALTLGVPPTPGNSIIRKPNNNNLLNVGTIFKNEGYHTFFYYGGDGYFDNMDNFFGNNGFDITDRQGRLIQHEKTGSTHSYINDKDVHFENAWGICDEDLYDAIIRGADEGFKRQESFFDFVMTTSNHRPYTYPAGKVKIPSGSGRDGAVSYTDYAIGRFLQKVKCKPWFANTVFIFIADHCARSAGKDGIDVNKYHIPCIIYNTQQKPFTVNRQCSQIDLFPTLFGLLNWKYTSNFYGKNVMLKEYKPRALLGTYQKLGYLQHDSLVVLSPERKAEAFLWNKTRDEQQPIPMDTSLLQTAIAYYQTAHTLFQNGGMKK